MAVAADQRVTARAWVTSIAALRQHRVPAGILELGAPARRATIEDLLVASAPRRSVAPVGSDAWLHLLGEGGVEELDDVLW
jgi:hypothetical protein